MNIALAVEKQFMDEIRAESEEVPQCETPEESSEEISPEGVEEE